MSIEVQASDILDRYFLETRAKLLEIAANLDRVGRAAGADEITSDPRLTFIQEALTILTSRDPHRAERIQRLYSKE